jgi:hypothetical protein
LEKAFQILITENFLVFWISVEIRFPYLVQKNLKEEKELHQVAQLDWKIIENNCERPFNVADLKFTPLPVGLHFFISLHPLPLFFFHFCDSCVVCFLFLNVGNAWRGLCVPRISLWE